MLHLLGFGDFITSHFKLHQLLLQLLHLFDHVLFPRHLTLISIRILLKRRQIILLSRLLSIQLHFLLFKVDKLLIIILLLLLIHIIFIVVLNTILLTMKFEFLLSLNESN